MPPTRRRPRSRVAEVADTFVELMRTFSRARARLLAAAEHDVEWSAQVLLKLLATRGPDARRARSPSCLQSDPSTVSRQVAALVKDGLLERRADPEDGRASLLVAHRRRPTPCSPSTTRSGCDHFAAMLADWSDADLRGSPPCCAASPTTSRRRDPHWITAPRSARPRAVRPGGRNALMSAPRPPAVPPPSGELSHKQIMTILSGLMLGMFLAALDQTIVVDRHPHHRRRPARPVGRRRGSPRPS